MMADFFSYVGFSVYAVLLDMLFSVYDGKRERP